MRQPTAYIDAKIEIDSTIVKKLQGEDGEAAMGLLFDRMWHPLFKIAYNLLKDNNDAKDIVQEVFIKLWDRRHDLQLTSSIQAYLYTSVRYSALTRLSKRMSEDRRNIPLENYIEQTFNESIDPLILKEIENEIDRQIAQLPDRMQEVILLKTKEDLSITEIAVRLGISEDTVKNHLAAARKRLRVKLGDLCYLALLIALS